MTLNPAICNPSWQGLALNTRLRPSIAEGLLRLLIFVVKEAWAPGSFPQGKPILVVVGSQNNFRSALAALGGRDDIAFATFHNFRQAGHDRMNFLQQYLSGLWVIPLLPLLWLMEKRPYVRRALLARTDEFVLAMGSGRGIRSYLRKAKPSLVIVLSNLSPYHNLIVEQARREGIATLFMTHAPLGRGQMPLSTDYAFLDGEHHLALLPSSGTKCAITGSGRGAELVQHYVDRTAAPGVLVATNTLIRDLGEIEVMVARLRQRYGSDMPFVIRPHPADRRRFMEHQRLAARVGAAYHDPVRPLHEGTENCKYLVTTMSGVVLDALLLGFYPLLLRSELFDNPVPPALEDYYGYGELKLAQSIDVAEPRLPANWEARVNLPLLEKAAEAKWDARAAVNSGIDRILAACSA